MLQKDIALYAMDNAIGFPNTSPLDSDLVQYTLIDACLLL